MEKGTVIYVGNFELPDKNAAAHRVMNNGKILRTLGFNIVYLGVVRGESFEGVRRSDYEENIFEEAYPTTSKKWIKHVFDPSNVLEVAGKYDDVGLVIAYNVPYASFKAMKKAFKGTAIKVAYDCTEWNPYAEGSLLKRLYKKLDEYQIRSFLGKKCKDIIVISRRMEEKYKGCNLLRLPPLVDVEDTIWRQEREEHTGTFEFCFSGTVSNKESIDVVVRAFGGIDDGQLRLRVIGVSSDEFAASFPETAKLAQADERVAFMGYVSHKESVQYILSADRFIFVREKTRRNDAGFPTKFAEAYTCAVPVITTDVSDVAEYITSDEKGAIVGDLSVDSVRSAMISELSKGRSLRPYPDRTFDLRNHISETKEWINRI